MNMRSRLILLVLCLVTAAFNKFPKAPGSFLEIRMKNQAAENTSDVPEPWTAKQLMAPADLAAIINDPNAKKPVILCVGPGALIRGSLDMGPAKEKENLEKLKQQLNKLPRDANVVIYCGCCPFEHCPNIRPAFILLNEMKFSNARLLNLVHNINTDWIAKGYPKA
jgi:thiosulfate/3-mercaptopyruvate sulfurtransferase